MKALDIASIFINRYGKTLALTNLTLNKLVYFAQVESLRNNPECPLNSYPLVTNCITLCRFYTVQNLHTV
ncbi:hypothetical protein HMPREF3208_00271 [Gardnerella vaginalis]|uniref:Uncharacterized protein n=1 Tax=Gardnerella vaginalis TaxID=2702 RepID=A0A133P228_GARVA|nr:hypothetical protein HMPREF3208_00271 [Gardnerella vaginalis]